MGGLILRLRAKLNGPWKCEPLPNAKLTLDTSPTHMESSGSLSYKICHNIAKIMLQLYELSHSFTHHVASYFFLSLCLEKAKERSIARCGGHRFSFSRREKDSTAVNLLKYVSMAASKTA